MFLKINTTENNFIYNVNSTMPSFIENGSVIRDQFLADRVMNATKHLFFTFPFGYAYYNLM
jgi:hypothetical protein